MENSELLINVGTHETRVALIEAGKVVEIHVERETNASLVGNIYYGKVVRVLPGMQAAFIEIGLEKAGYLHLSNIGTEDKFATIQSLLYPSLELKVQVIKDPMGNKGARLTTNLTIPSRHLVLVPKANYVGISYKIKDEKSKERLKEILTPHVSSQNGFIIRTSAIEADAEDIENEVIYLKSMWQKIKDKTKTINRSNPLLYKELSLPLRIVRDFIGKKLDTILIDNKNVASSLQKFCDIYMHALQPKIVLVTPEVLNSYKLDLVIAGIMQPRVELKSGGYIVIEQTEAMISIDVNTGSFVGTNQQKTALIINLEAAEAIAFELRLRNHGGIIVIDFIDMNTDDEREKVLNYLKLSLKRDKVKTTVYGFSELGLVAMTRKRTTESLTSILTDSCIVCGGMGYLKSAETVCYEIIREILRFEKLYKVEEYKVNCAAAVYSCFLKNSSLKDLGLVLNKQIIINVDITFPRHKFDIIL